MLLQGGLGPGDYLIVPTTFHSGRLGKFRMAVTSLPCNACEFEVLAVDGSPLPNVHRSQSDGLLEPWEFFAGPGPLSRELSREACRSM